MMDLRKVSDEVLGAKLLELVSKERSLLCMIIICVIEIARRKTYLSTHPDLFSYLTDLLKYSHGSAQRRKDAALLALEVPSILNDVKSGSLNLSQITLAQSAFRLNERLNKKASKETDYKIPAELKKQILIAIKDKSVAESEVIIYSMLNIKPKSRTKLTRQSDGSVRCETTHSKLQWEKIERTKELLSHSVPTGEMTDLIEYLCDRVISFKDKTVPKQSRKQASSKAKMSNPNESSVPEACNKDNRKSSAPKKSEMPSDIGESARVGGSDGNELDASKVIYDKSRSSFDSKERSRKCVTFSKLENCTSKVTDTIPCGIANASDAENLGGTGNFEKLPDGIASCPSPTRFVKPKSRSVIPTAVQRHIFSRDKCCQHVSPDGKPCDSRWQLQIDHIQPIWAGGSDDVENLRLLCGAHNRALYRRQSGMNATSGLVSF